VNDFHTLQLAGEFLADLKLKPKSTKITQNEPKGTCKGVLGRKPKSSGQEFFALPNETSGRRTTLNKVLCSARMVLRWNMQLKIVYFTQKQHFHTFGRFVKSFKPTKNL
jgi:hypothetical protein